MTVGVRGVAQITFPHNIGPPFRGRASCIAMLVLPSTLMLAAWSPPAPLGHNSWMDRLVVERLYTARAEELATQLARQFPRQRHHAPDAVQHAFLKLAESEDVVLDPGGWVARAANNYMIDQLRKETRLVHEADDFHLDDLPAHTSAFGQAQERQHTLGVLHRALDLIGDPGRAMLVLKYMHGYDYAQIAVTLGVPQASVGTTLLRARRKLRDLLQARGITAAPLF